MSSKINLNSALTSSKALNFVKGGAIAAIFAAIILATPAVVLSLKHQVCVNTLRTIGLSSLGGSFVLGGIVKTFRDKKQPPQDSPLDSLYPCRSFESPPPPICSRVYPPGDV